MAFHSLRRASGSRCSTSSFGSFGASGRRARSTSMASITPCETSTRCPSRSSDRGSCGRGGPRSLALAARHGDEYNTFHKGVDECRELRALLDGACEREGRDPATLPLSLMAGVSIGRDHSEQDDEWVTGSVGEAAAYLRVLDEVGVRRVMLQHLDHEDLEMVELIGRELAPAVA
jgi:hypothetical protein